MSEQQSSEDFAAAQAAEYGTYRAVSPIYFGGALAFAPGNAVPISHVTAYKYDEQGLVEKVDTSQPDPQPQPAQKAPALTPQNQES